MDWAAKLGFSGPVLIYQADDLGLGYEENDGIAVAARHARLDTISACASLDPATYEDILAGDVGLHVVSEHYTSYKETTDLIQDQYDRLSRWVVPSHIDSHGGVLFASRQSTLAYIHFARRNRILPLMWSGHNPYQVADLFHLSGFPLLSGVHVCHGDPKSWSDRLFGSIISGIHLLIFHPKRENRELLFLLEEPRPSGFQFADWRGLSRRYFH